MKRIYATQEERQAARNARQNAKRALLMTSGLTTKGTPRKRHVRGAAIHSIGSRHLVQAPVVPCQSVDEWIAMGDTPERLPGLAFSVPPQMPVSAERQGLRAA
jgi:hypothetical protein